MRRADRLFQIVQYVRNRRLTTARWLAEKLEVSERTVYRDIQHLVLCGVPIEGEAGVGYVLRRGFDIPPIMFTQDELEALVIATRMAKTWASNQLARATEQALDKIEAVLPDKLRPELTKPQLYSPSILANEDTAAILDDIRAAMHAKRVMLIHYTSLQGQLSKREIKPLGLFFWGKVWTLAAWCELKQDYRSFRVDRIAALWMTDRDFDDNATVSLSQFLKENFAGLDEQAFMSR